MPKCRRLEPAIHDREGAGLTMPVFHIQYTTPRTDHAVTEDIEWVTEAHWDQQRTRQCFQARYPDAAVLHITEVQCQHFR